MAKLRKKKIFFGSPQYPPPCVTVNLNVSEIAKKGAPGTHQFATKSPNI